MRTLTIYDEIPSWSVDAESLMGFYPEKKNRAYDIWGHAAGLVVSNANSFQKSDCVLSLKRAVDHRLQLIEDIYHLSKCSNSSKYKHRLELFEHYGIVRATMLRDLIELRNAIEHKDKQPPSQRRCTELVDLTWYFLKSTDSMVSRCPSSLIYSHPEHSEYWIKATIANQQIKIMGWLPPTLINNSNCSIIVFYSRRHTRQKILDKLTKKERRLLESARDERGIHPEDVFIDGSIKDSKWHEMFFKRFFDVVVNNDF